MSPLSGFLKPDVPPLIACPHTILKAWPWDVVPAYQVG